VTLLEGSTVTVPSSKTSTKLCRWQLTTPLSVKRRVICVRHKKYWNTGLNQCVRTFGLVAYFWPYSRFKEYARYTWPAGLSFYSRNSLWPIYYNQSLVLRCLYYLCSYPHKFGCARGWRRTPLAKLQWYIIPCLTILILHWYRHWLMIVSINWLLTCTSM
jgi:hypothetical protein